MVTDNLVKFPARGRLSTSSITIEVPSKKVKEVVALLKEDEEAEQVVSKLQAALRCEQGGVCTVLFEETLELIGLGVSL